MRLFRTIVWLCMTVFSTATVVAEDSEEEQQWQFVAAVLGTDKIAHIRVDALLESNGIDCRIDTLIHGNISVPTPHVNKARKLLKRDATDGGYYMIFPNGERIEARKRTLVNLHQPIDKVLAKDEYAANTTIGQWLRTPKMAATLQRYPFVKSLEMQERPYFMDKHAAVVGIDVRVILLRNAEGTAGYSGSFQVLADAKAVVCHSFSYWSQEDTGSTPERTEEPERRAGVGREGER